MVIELFVERHLDTSCPSLLKCNPKVSFPVSSSSLPPAHLLLEQTEPIISQSLLPRWLFSNAFLCPDVLPSKSVKMFSFF